jgi:hypothetical protein
MKFNLLGLVCFLLVLFAVAHGVVYIRVNDLAVACIVSQVDLVGVHFWENFRLAVQQVVDSGVVGEAARARHQVIRSLFGTSGRIVGLHLNLLYL